MSEFIARLRNDGARVVQVEAGQEFEAISLSHYRVNPSSAADYARLMQELDSTDSLPGYIVHAWTVTTLDLGAEKNGFDAVQSLGFYSLLFLTQALNRNAVYKPIQLDVLTNN